jgi:hypothetical protein
MLLRIVRSLFPLVGALGGGDESSRFDCDFSHIPHAAPKGRFPDIRPHLHSRPARPSRRWDPWTCPRGALRSPHAWDALQLLIASNFAASPEVSVVPLLLSAQGLLEGEQAKHQEEATTEAVEQFLADAAANPLAGAHRQPGDQGVAQQSAS